MKAQFVEKCLEVLVKDQNISSEELVNFRSAHGDQPDSIFLFFFLVFMSKRGVCWPKFLDELENLFFQARDSQEEFLIKTGFLEPIYNMMTSGRFDRTSIYPHLGPLSKKFINEEEQYDRNPPIIVSRRNAQVEAVVEALCRQQKIKPRELNLLRLKNLNVDDGNFLFAILRHLMIHPEQTNWRVLLNGLEEIKSNENWKRK
ncbi:hypothetical protein [Bdellovibrio sp. HCB2-146]|uniref:hypothetical protein n=1 Tax=Bdellovibrio sp. HCB2-146 TaxID=3394362 RepID=UPI0039BCEF39